MSILPIWIVLMWVIIRQNEFQTILFFKNIDFSVIFFRPPFMFIVRNNYIQQSANEISCSKISKQLFNNHKLYIMLCKSQLNLISYMCKAVKGLYSQNTLQSHVVTFYSTLHSLNTCTRYSCSFN